MGLFVALRHWKESGHAFAVVNLSERLRPRWLVVDFAEVLVPFGSGACFAVEGTDSFGSGACLAVEGTDSSGSGACLAVEGIDSFGSEANLVGEGIDPEECFVVVERP